MELENRIRTLEERLAEVEQRRRLSLTLTPAAKAALAGLVVQVAANVVSHLLMH